MTFSLDGCHASLKVASQLEVEALHTSHQCTDGTSSSDAMGSLPALSRERIRSHITNWCRWPSSNGSAACVCLPRCSVAVPTMLGTATACAIDGGASCMR